MNANANAQRKVAPQAGLALPPLLTLAATRTSAPPFPVDSQLHLAPSPPPPRLRLCPCPIEPSGYAAGCALGLGAALLSLSSGASGMGAVVTPKGYKLKSSPLKMGSDTVTPIGSRAFASENGKGKTVGEAGYDVGGTDIDIAGGRAGTFGGVGAGAQTDTGGCWV